MTTLTENPHAGGFLVSEANGKRSREQVVLALGQNLQAGTVLGKVTASAEYEAYDNTLATGIEVADAILFEAVDATVEAKAAVVIKRDAEVNEAELIFDEANDAAAQTAGLADLAALGIVAR